MVYLIWPQRPVVHFLIMNFLQTLSDDTPASCGENKKIEVVGREVRRILRLRLVIEFGMISKNCSCYQLEIEIRGITSYFTFSLSSHFDPWESTWNWKTIARSSNSIIKFAGRNLQAHPVRQVHRRVEDIRWAWWWNASGGRITCVLCGCKSRSRKWSWSVSLYAQE